MKPGKSAARVAIACAIAASLASPAPPALGGLPDKPAVAAKKKGKKHRAKHAKHGTVAKKPPPPPPPPLDGTSYDYGYDGRADGHRERAWLGRVFVHRKAAEATGRSLPLLVFLHGNNGEGIKYRWMGGGAEGDLRRIVSDLIETGVVPPMLVAAPSSTNPDTMTNAILSWPAFDLDLFLDKTEERLGQAAVIDRGRVVVAAHSGAGCNIHGGLNAALHAKGTPVLAGFSIDTCMLLDLAKDLAHLRPTTHVVVSWQSMSWPEREFGGFSAVFQREVKKDPPPAGVLRELDYEQPSYPQPHDAMVGITLKKWLPRVLGPGQPPAPPPPPPDPNPTAAAAPDGGSG